MVSYDEKICLTPAFVGCVLEQRRWAKGHCDVVMSGEKKGITFGCREEHIVSSDPGIEMLVYELGELVRKSRDIMSNEWHRVRYTYYLLDVVNVARSTFCRVSLVGFLSQLCGVILQQIIYRCTCW